MKAGKVVLAGMAGFVFSSIVGALTCGWLFNWVYQLEPVNVWKPMSGPPSAKFYAGALLLNIILALVYALLNKGIPGKSKLAKGLVFGLCVWAVGVLPGMFSMAAFMTVARGVVAYWTLLDLVALPLKGLIIAAIYGE